MFITWLFSVQIGVQSDLVYGFDIVNTYNYSLWLT